MKNVKTFESFLDLFGKKTKHGVSYDDIENSMKNLNSNEYIDVDMFHGWCKSIGNLKNNEVVYEIYKHREISFLDFANKIYKELSKLGNYFIFFKGKKNIKEFMEFAKENPTYHEVAEEGILRRPERISFLIKFKSDVDINTDKDCIFCN